MSLTTVPVNTHACFPKSAAGGEGGCTDCVYRGTPREQSLVCHPNRPLQRAGWRLYLHVGCRCPSGRHTLWKKYLNTHSVTVWQKWVVPVCTLGPGCGEEEEEVHALAQSSQPASQVVFVYINWGFRGSWSLNPFPTQRILAPVHSLETHFLPSHFLSGCYLDGAMCQPGRGRWQRRRWGNPDWYT